MNRLKERRWAIALAGVAVWLAISACSCGDALSNLSERNSAKKATATAESQWDGRIAKATRPPSATPVPTAEATKRPPTRTPIPTATMLPVPKVQGLSGFVLPDKSDQEFIIKATQAEINDELRGQVYEMEGLTLRDVSAVVNRDEIIADLQGTYDEMGISAGVRVRGVPSVVGGQAYVDILEVTLDNSIPGLIRLAAQRMIQDAIEQNSKEHGIAIPVEGVEVLSIELEPQLLTITGRTR